MSTNEFTPGPWALMDLGDYTDFDGRSQVVMSEDLSGDNPFRLAVVHVSDAEGAANARLIAAAPDLLEALKRIAAIENQMYGGDWDEIEEAREIALAAIAEAIGAQS